MENFEHKAELSEKEIEKILFLTFMFSQGSSVLQKAILIAIATRIGQQNQDLTESAFKKMTVKIRPPNTDKSALVTANIHPDVPDINLRPYFQLHTIFPLTEDTEFAEEPVDFIAMDIWNRDWQYLCCKKKERTNRGKDFKPDTLQDPHFSFGVHYIERENDTGNVHFDSLLEQVRDVPRQNFTKRLDVIRRYNETHPDSPLESL